MLNEAQHRSLSVALRFVEEATKEIEHLLTKNGEEGILYAIHDDWTQNQRETLRAGVNAVLAIVRDLADRFHLTREEVPATRKVFG
jgi:hypothetical protein